jgi:hypothetical protein
VEGFSNIANSSCDLLFHGRQNMNDNFELSFVSLAALTANVVLFLQLEEKQPNQSEREADTNSAREQNAERERDNIDDNLFPFRAIM